MVHTEERVALMRRTDEIRDLIARDGRFVLAITVGETVWDELAEEWDGPIEDLLTVEGIPVHWCADLVGIDVEFSE